MHIFTNYHYFQLVSKVTEYVVPTECQGLPEELQMKLLSPDVIKLDRWETAVNHSLSLLQERLSSWNVFYRTILVKHIIYDKEYGKPISDPVINAFREPYVISRPFFTKNMKRNEEWHKDILQLRYDPELKSQDEIYETIDRIMLHPIFKQESHHKPLNQAMRVFMMESQLLFQRVASDIFRPLPHDFNCINLKEDYSGIHWLTRNTLDSLNRWVSFQQIIKLHSRDMVK